MKRFTFISLVKILLPLIAIFLIVSVEFDFYKITIMQALYSTSWVIILFISTAIAYKVYLFTAHKFSNNLLTFIIGSLLVHLFYSF